MASYRKIEEIKPFLEMFDMTDKETYTSLALINESEQKEVVVNMSKKLYQNMAKYKKDIDFDLIKASKGDIDAIPGFDNTLECIEIVKQLKTIYGEDIDQALAVEEAIRHIRSMKTEFARAYMVEAQIPIDIYECMSYTIIAATTMLCTELVGFMANPNGATQVNVNFVNMVTTAVVVTGKGTSKQDRSKPMVKMPIRKNIAQDGNRGYRKFTGFDSVFMFSYLDRFNNACRNGSMKTLVEKCIQADAKNITGALEFVMFLGFAVGALVMIIPLMRELIYFFYYLRTRLSDFFSVQSEMLAINAARLDNDGNKAVANKQRVWVERLRKTADFFTVDVKEASIKAEKQIREDDKKKVKITDVKDSLPDAAAASYSPSNGSSLF